MSQKAHVVDGEASESDTEVEKEAPKLDSSANTKAFVIDGEAPESDEESQMSSRSGDVLDTPITTKMSPQSGTMRNLYTSLLHQKLWECNVSLRATIDGLVKHTTDISVEKLTRADKILLNVQESMRATSANLSVGAARLTLLRDQLEAADCGSALPTVLIK